MVPRRQRASWPQQADVLMRVYADQFNTKTPLSKELWQIYDANVLHNKPFGNIPPLFKNFIRAMKHYDLHSNIQKWRVCNMCHIMHSNTSCFLGFSLQNVETSC